MTDARFADGAEQPLRLRALDAEDLPALSALIQDAVFPITELSWSKAQRRFGILLNRFRWEDADAATARSRPFERVQSVLTIEDALAVRSQGIDRGDKNTILSVLSVGWIAGDDGMGTVELTLAGDGAIAVDVEALEITLTDVTRPYIAPSGQKPAHSL